jgi:hypothetical protein
MDLKCHLVGLFRTAVMRVHPEGSSNSTPLSSFSSHIFISQLLFVLEVVPRQRRVPPFFIEVYS